MNVHEMEIEIEIEQEHMKHVIEIEENKEMEEMHHVNKKQNYFSYLIYMFECLLIEMFVFGC
jgi:hypothetical protein